MNANHFKIYSVAPVVRMFLGVALGLGLLAGTAFATPSNPFPPESQNDTPYMTLDQVSSQKTTFGWDEKPFIYSLLDGINPSRTLNMTHTWKFGDTVVATTTDTYPEISSLKNWKGLENWTDQDIRRLGTWNVDTEWGYVGSKYTVLARNSFTVTPEPFGAALFLIGGLAIVLRKKLKQKTSERENIVVPV